MKFKILVSFVFALVSVGFCFAQAGSINSAEQYKLLATTKTSTMQKELDQTSSQGFRVIVGAPTSGNEIALFLAKDSSVDEPYKYKLLATSRTSTMQKELNEMAQIGFRLIPSTMVAKRSIFDAVEIVMIMELTPSSKKLYEYRLLATSLTGTLQKEVTEAKLDGFVLVGMVSRDEHMVVMEKEIN